MPTTLITSDSLYVSGMNRPIYASHARMNLWWIPVRPLSIALNVPHWTLLALSNSLEDIAQPVRLAISKLIQTSLVYHE